MSMTIDVGRIHTERHLTLAAGLDLRNAVPVTRGLGERLAVGVDVADAGQDVAIAGIGL